MVHALLLLSTHTNVYIVESFPSLMGDQIRIQDNFLLPDFSYEVNDDDEDNGQLEGEDWDDDGYSDNYSDNDYE